MCLRHLPKRVSDQMNKEAKLQHLTIQIALKPYKRKLESIINKKKAQIDS